MELRTLSSATVGMLLCLCTRGRGEGLREGGGEGCIKVYANVFVYIAGYL